MQQANAATAMTRTSEALPIPSLNEETITIPEHSEPTLLSFSVEAASLNSSGLDRRGSFEGERDTTIYNYKILKGERPMIT